MRRKVTDETPCTGENAFTNLDTPLTLRRKILCAVNDLAFGIKHKKTHHCETAERILLFIFQNLKCLFLICEVITISLLQKLQYTMIVSQSSEPNILSTECSEQNIHTTVLSFKHSKIVTHSICHTMSACPAWFMS